jgi:hypothetical protein
MQVIEVSPREWDIKIGLSLKEAQGIYEWLRNAESKLDTGVTEAHQSIETLYRILEKLTKELREDG